MKCSRLLFIFSDLMTPSQSVGLTRQEYRSSHHCDSHYDSQTGIPSASTIINHHIICSIILTLSFGFVVCLTKVGLEVKYSRLQLWPSGVNLDMAISELVWEVGLLLSVRIMRNKKKWSKMDWVKSKLYRYRFTGIFQNSIHVLCCILKCFQHSENI